MDSLKTDHNLPLKLMTSSVLSVVQLLGMDLAGMERVHKLTTPLNTLTFVKPNAKAFELIIHFLLTQLDEERAQRTFTALCWPTLLKEQQKEFKEIVFNWLSELASSSSSSSNKKPTTTTSLYPPTQTQLIQQKHQTTLSEVKFPLVTKSLLQTPGGLKCCELLFALSHYVLLVRVIRETELNNSHVNLRYRAAPFQPIGNTGAGDVSSGKQPPLSHIQQTPGGLSSPSFGTVPATPSLTNSSNTKPLNTRQLVHYERLNASLDLKIEMETERFERNLSNLTRKRLAMQQKSQEKMISVQSLLEAKRHHMEALQRKKAELSKYLGCSEENISCESMHNHLAEFERNWSQFVQICNRTVNDSSSQEAVSDVVGKKEFELDGETIVGGLRDTGISEQRIANTVYANIDQGVNVKNVNSIGPLIQDGKLDLINLTRWHNLTMSVVVKALTNIDTKKISAIARSFNKESDGGLAADCSTLDDASVSMNILAENKAINQEASILKTKLDAFLPKFSEKTEKLFERIRTEFESDMMSKEKQGELQDENVFEFINGYFNLVSGPIIDQERLDEIKKAAQQEKEDEEEEQQQQVYHYQDSSLPIEEDDFPKENFLHDDTSLGMIDVDDSNYDLI